MSEMIARLENNFHQRTSGVGSCIQFEDNRLLKGREHLAPLYQAILKRCAILLEYRSFKALAAKQQIYHPYLLKEYRNRWFLIAKPKKGKTLLTLALDRVLEFQELPNEKYIPWEGIGFEQYFSDLIGVTKTENERARGVVFHVNKTNAPYLLTKPLRHSQRVLREDEKRRYLRVDVVINFELERELPGFGECLKVLSPRFLQARILRRINAAAARYQIDDV